MAAGDEGHLVCGQSAFRAIAAVTQYVFHSPQGGNATDAGKPKGIGRKSRQFLPAQLGPSCASHRRSSNANSLCGRNSAGSPEICATFQRDILRRHF
jgi:hypothetical protein